MSGYVIRNIVKVAVALAVLIVGYNYFWGNEEEQQSSTEIVGQVKDLTGSVVNLLKAEKDKFDKGKYDDALSKIKTTVSLLKESATAMGEGGQDVLDRLNALEEQRKELEQKLADLESNDGSQGADSEASGGPDQETAESIRQEILKLNQEAEDLAQQLNNT